MAASSLASEKERLDNRVSSLSLARAAIRVPSSSCDEAPLLEAVTSSRAVAAVDRIKAESSTASVWPATTKFSNQQRETTKNINLLHREKCEFMSRT